MSTFDRLADLGSQGFRISLTLEGKLSTRTPTTLPVDEVQAWIRDNRDGILALVADLDRALALACRILDGVARKASHHPPTLAVVAMYRETIIELRERLEPLASESDEAARRFAARTVIPVQVRRVG